MTCSVCGYQYDEQAKGTPFHKLPEQWHCPICNAPKSAFAKGLSKGARNKVQG